MNRRLLLCITMLLTGLVLAGCNAFSPPALHLSIEKDSMGNTSDVELTTRYELEQGGTVTYNPETKLLEVDLGSATTKSDEMMMMQIMRMMEVFMGMYATLPPGNTLE